MQVIGSAIRQTADDRGRKVVFPALPAFDCGLQVCRVESVRGAARLRADDLKTHIERTLERISEFLTPAREAVGAVVAPQFGESRGEGINVPLLLRLQTVVVLPEARQIALNAGATAVVPAPQFFV